jgi:hypothetical protein
MAAGDDDTRKQILVTIANTERNFLLKKGESTVGLEERRLSSEEGQRLIDLFKSLLAHDKK